MFEYNGLTDTQLEKLCKQYDIPLQGIFEKDDFPIFPHGNFIVNLNGHSHWCAIICDKDYFWFDSYGFQPPKNIEDIIKHLSFGYYWNDKDMQDINSTSCGYFCLAFLKFMNVPNKKKAYETFINLFDKDTRKNEKILFSLL